MRLPLRLYRPKQRWHHLLVDEALLAPGWQRVSPDDALQTQRPWRHHNHTPRLVTRPRPWRQRPVQALAPDALARKRWQAIQLREPAHLGRLNRRIAFAITPNQPWRLTGVKKLTTARWQALLIIPPTATSQWQPATEFDPIPNTPARWHRVALGGYQQKPVRWQPARLDFLKASARKPGKKARCHWHSLPVAMAARPWRADVAKANDQAIARRPLPRVMFSQSRWLAARKRLMDKARQQNLAEAHRIEGLNVYAMGADPKRFTAFTLDEGGRLWYKPASGRLAAKPSGLQDKALAEGDAAWPPAQLFLVGRHTPSGESVYCWWPFEGF